MRVRFTPRVIRDLTRIREYIANDRPGAAARVTTEVQTLASMLSEQPDAGRSTSRTGIRLMPTPRLPYLVFDRHRGGAIEILNVRDGRRRPLT